MIRRWHRCTIGKMIAKNSSTFKLGSLFWGDKQYRIKNIQVGGITQKVKMMLKWTYFHGGPHVGLNKSFVRTLLDGAIYWSCWDMLLQIIHIYYRPLSPPIDVAHVNPCFVRSEWSNSSKLLIWYYNSQSLYGKPLINIWGLLRNLYCMNSQSQYVLHIGIYHVNTLHFPCAGTMLAHRL